MQADTDHLVSIPTPHRASEELIGGKARSLQRMAQAGMPVPPAFVLSTRFFQPWYDTVFTLDSWQALPDAHPDAWPGLCDASKAVAIALPLSDGQRAALSALGQRLSAHGATALFAVRSSALDEDLAAASFAGIYETELGVTIDAMEAAIRRCFAASLDHRVLVYKQSHRLDPYRPAIALIVQQQLASDVAGVAFSINPLNNDFDEAVIEANWGLGDTVVSGAASTDHFIVDKVSGVVRERQLGAKQLAMVLNPGGGTDTRQGHRCAEFCLSDQQVNALGACLCKIETLYGHPVDVEWAFAGGRLWILQARPVTSYVPLPPAMTSAPGARRSLYMDVALSKGLTINAPISPAALDWLGQDIEQLLRRFTGGASYDLTDPDGLLFLAGARMYINLSNLLWYISPEKLASSSAPTDQLMADIIGAIDAGTYRSALRPAWLGRALRVAPRAFWSLRRPAWRVLRSLVAPNSTARLYKRETQAFEARYTGSFDNHLALDAFQHRYGSAAMKCVIDVVMPALGVGVLALGAARALANKRRPEELMLVEQLTQGISGNLVVEMGIHIFRMAKMLGPEQLRDLPALADKIGKRQVPQAFLAAWDAFMLRYGCRGPGEMDLANARYRDEPMQLLRQMSFMVTDSGGFDPAAAHQQLALQREQAYLALLKRFGWLRRALLRRIHTLIGLFGGTRDTAKHYNLLYLHAVRQRLLSEGRALADAGHLDLPQHVFDLAAADLGGGDGARDLRGKRAQRRAFLELLTTQVRNFPAVIDSRGRILRAPRTAEKPGELAGTPVSPGLARGRVKRLRTAHEKPVAEGDVLVAYTTDPGWTPLFVNAAAVVLEVGGVLQHGAVVAREYGKPCVVGIQDVMSRLRDGQLVEVDGNLGVVRIVTEQAAGVPQP